MVQRNSFICTISHYYRIDEFFLLLLKIEDLCSIEHNSAEIVTGKLSQTMLTVIVFGKIESHNFPIVGSINILAIRLKFQKYLKMLKIDNIHV